MYRYTGCVIKVYRPEEIDCLVKFQTCYPMSASNFLYMGCQPSIMSMSKGCKRIRSLKNAPNSRPYKKFKLPPPQQMTNKWLFQSQHSKTGLLLIQSCAASFTQYFLSKESESQVINLKTLNTKIFQNLNFRNLPTYGYIPKQNFALYMSNGSDKVGDLHWLGNTIEYQQGKSFNNIPGTDFKTRIQTYMQDRKNWGNPFHHTVLSKSWKIWFGPNNPNILFATGTTTPAQISMDTPINQTQLKEVTQELIFDCRYNPNTDKGYDSMIYLKSNWKESENLDPPTDKDLITAGFPAWLSAWGFETTI